MKKERPDSNYKSRFIQCWIIAACIAGLSFTMMLAPFVNYSAEAGSRMSGIILSVITWAFVLGAAVLAQRVWMFVSCDAAGDQSAAGERYKHARIGLFTFAANPEGTAADIMLLLGIILLGLRTFHIVHAAGIFRMLPYSVLSAGVLLHCLFNGKNYIYIKSKSNYARKRGVHV